MITFLMVFLSTSLVVTAGEQQVTREIIPQVLRAFVATADRSSSSEAVGLTHQRIKKQLGRLALTSTGLKSLIESEEFIYEMHPAIVQALCDAKARETHYNRQKPVIKITVSDKKMQQELASVMNSVLNDHAAWFPTVAPILAYLTIPSDASSQKSLMLRDEFDLKAKQVTTTMDHYFDNPDKKKYVSEIDAKINSARGRFIAFCEVELSLKTSQ